MRKLLLLFFPLSSLVVILSCFFLLSSKTDQAVLSISQATAAKTTLHQKKIRATTSSLPTPTLKATVTPSPTKTPTPTQTLKPSPTLTPTKTPQVTLTPTPTSQPPQAQSESDSDKAFIMQKINEYRLSQGLGSVQTDSQTCSFAKTRASEISQSFNHDGFRSRIDNKSLPYPSYKEVTENIAMTSNYKDVVTMWINSPGHAENMRRDTPFICVERNGNFYAYEGWRP